MWVRVGVRVRFRVRLRHLNSYVRSVIVAYQVYPI